jgi:hypothetical protein
MAIFVANDPLAVLRALRAGRESIAVQLSIARGERDANTLTNMVFFARHPERKGKKLAHGEPNFGRLSREWLDIRNRLVQPPLQPSSAQSRAPLQPSPASRAAWTERAPTTLLGVPPVDGPKEPAGYQVKYRRIRGRTVKRGLARYGGGRVDRRLKSLRDRGLFNVSDEEIDLFQRIANVETDGQIQGLNTWDSAVVSIGFMQWTLQHGKLQGWISRAPEAFRRYGIELDSSRTYWWNGKSQAAIKGAATKEELRWDGWAQRFYLAGLDEEIIAAEVALARSWIRQHLNSLKRRLRATGMLADYDLFMHHYRRSPRIRGLFQEAYNNLPLAGRNGTVSALQAAKREGTVSTERFLAILQGAIRQAYIDLDDNGENVIRKTLSGAQP